MPPATQRASLRGGDRGGQGAKRCNHQGDVRRDRCRRASACEQQRTAAGHESRPGCRRDRPAAPIPTTPRSPRQCPEDRERPAAEIGDAQSRAAPGQPPKQRAAARLRLAADRPRPGLPASRVRGRPRQDPACAASPPKRRSRRRIFGDGAFQRGAVEIRPERRNENELAIGRLPEQEIRQPLLAAGADDEIRIRQIRRVEEAGDRSQRSHLLAVEPAGVRRLPPSAVRARTISWRAAVVECDDQRQPIVALAVQLLGFFQQPPHIGSEIGALADDAHAHIVLGAARRDRCG